MIFFLCKSLDEDDNIYKSCEFSVFFKKIISKLGHIFPDSFESLCLLCWLDTVFHEFKISSLVLSKPLKGY